MKIYNSKRNQLSTLITSNQKQLTIKKKWVQKPLTAIIFSVSEKQLTTSKRSAQNQINSICLASFYRVLWVFEFIVFW